ncbi:hypothetical protein P170DRAFT_357297 [Aspergillus steynii IBT 23096]|uniref:Zn(2)-C6 fungal-type domain-containing protein n=1 Tax=Aspergillus steynii IBT 23096 TaxID=1392250 RepID=A0A2I2G9X8_9EURO|nr:uncharacterized protein P170DRAFT_357297 [Aspergillus steynii IBT 23096]PLB49686.1 hypothetical protein P170DRAFT_357297 [Aspergillus steynii IBT 23096]
MTSTAQTRRKPNSLAFAQTDCHTCAASGVQCDRQRPQCTTCLNQGRKCGGFATPLSWDDRRTYRAGVRPATSEAEQANTGMRGERAPRSRQTRPFRFVLGGKRERKRRRVDQLPDEACLQVFDGSTGRIESAIGEGADADGTGFECAAGSVALETPDRSFDFPNLVPGAGDPGLSVAQQDYLQSLLQVDTSTPDLNGMTLMERSNETSGVSVLEDIFEDGLQFLNADNAPLDGVVSTFRAPIMESSGGGLGGGQVGNEHDALLQLYDTEFCILPLTSDTALNPFRYRKPLPQGSKLLFHSILALCCRHISQITGTWSSEEREHRSQAMKLLEYTLRNDQLTREGLTLLDPILILFTLDCTISASGQWSTHLTRVFSILESCGGVSALNNARIRAQVAMVVWWDITLALVSRHGTVFPEAYLKRLTQAEKHDKWSFYDLTGCPSDLVVNMFQLAQLAHQSEIASSMTWLSFDLAPVIQIHSHLKNGKSFSSSFPTPDPPNSTTAAAASSKEPGNSAENTEEESEESFHAQEDQHHCIEAWRHALLLYIERIFKWDRSSERRPAAIPRLLRITLDHVRCCRRTSQTQKQLLLPVFLAGSETGDEEMQQVVREYCQWWGERSRYNMFHSVPTLLEDVWGGNKWWGAVVDEKTRAAGNGAKVQFLFG